MEVDEPGCHDDAVRVDAVGLLALEPGDRLEDAASNDDLAGPFPPGGRVDQPGAPDVEVGHAA